MTARESSLVMGALGIVCVQLAPRCTVDGELAIIMLDSSSDANSTKEGSSFAELLRSSSMHRAAEEPEDSQGGPNSFA
jgi:hypothetical protein